MKHAKTVNSYIAAFPQSTQELLLQLRQTIVNVAPAAVESISYGMPTYKLDGRPLAYFAAYAHHIGFYPTSSPIAAFAKELAPYHTGKGSVQFPLDQPLPLELIQRIVAFRMKKIATTTG